MKDYRSLLNVKCKYFYVNIIVLLIIILSIILFVLIETYNSYSTNGVYMNNEFIISVPVKNSDAVLNGEYLMINNNKYSYEITKISALNEMNYINYQDYFIKIKNIHFKQNEVLEITFYYNKEKIIKKIIDIIF